MNKKLMELMTIREAADDEIWEITEKQRKEIRVKFDNTITVEAINIWPEDGIEFSGYYKCGGDLWSETISWKEWEKFNEG
jgi:hypothetical protein